VDQNRLRDWNVISGLISRARNHEITLLLPDVAMFEMTKSRASWESTVRASLRLIAEFPAGVAVARNLGRLLTEEGAAGTATTAIENDESTQELRRVLWEVAHGDGPSFASLRVLVPQAQSDEQAPGHLGDAAHHKRRLEERIEAWREELTPDHLRRVRNDFEREFLPTVRDSALSNACSQSMISNGVPSASARVLSSTVSTWLVYFTALSAQALYWLAKGGSPQMSAAKVANDVHDLEYIVLGALCEAVESNERGRFQEVLRVANEVADFVAIAQNHRT